MLSSNTAGKLLVEVHSWSGKDSFASKGFAYSLLRLSDFQGLAYGASISVNAEKGEFSILSRGRV